MAEITGQPFRGQAKIEVNNGTGTRHFTCSVADVSPTSDPADQDADWDYTSGAEVTLRFEWGTSGVTPTSQATTARIELRQWGAIESIGSRWTVSISGNSGSDTITMHFDDEPFDSLLGTPVWGGIELWFWVENEGTWGPADTKGNFDNAGVRSSDWARGYFRSRVQLDTLEISNASLGGAEPATWAYPDPVYVRATMIGTPAAGTVNGSCELVKPDGTVLETKSETNGGQVQEFSFTGDSEVVDAEWDTQDNYGVRLTLPDFTMDQDDELAWATSGHPANWTVEDEDNLFHSTRIQNVDSRVTLSGLANDKTLSTVYNRGETATGDLTVQNARGEGFAAIGGHELSSVDSGTNTAEQTISEGSGITRTDDLLDWSVTFATSGNQAPQDSTGASKVWRWRAGGGNTPSPSDTSQFGLLSSLYDLARHLQVNDNALDPAQNMTERLTANIGFFSVKITNQQGEAVNGATGDLTLADDGDLTTAIVETNLTTGTQNGNDGYTPLKIWDSQLPSGLWDLFASTQFTKDGNSTNDSRKGSGSGDFTLLSNNPSFVVMAGGGPVNDADNHASVGVAFQGGVSLIDTLNNLRIPIQSADLAFVRLADSSEGANEGFGQFLDSDGETWVTLSDPVTGTQADNIVFHTAAETRTNSDVYVVQFTAAQTSNWGGNMDVFVLARVKDSKGVPYTNYAQLPVVGTANKHSGNSLDPIAASQGIISFR